MLSNNCNKNCYYCYLHHHNKNLYEVDLDYIKYIMKFFIIFKDISVCLSGGEPGLCNNLPQLVDYFLSLPNLKNKNDLNIVSNGLVRQNFDFTSDIRYEEHLILEIYKNKIIKFYDMPFVSSKTNKNIVIMTKHTTESLLNNTELATELLEFSEFKILNKKNNNFIDLNTYYDSLYSFYIKYGLIGELKQLASYRDSNLHIENKRSCCLSHTSATLDLDSNSILQCGGNPILSKSYEINSDNLIALLNKKLFNFSSLCEKCYYYDVGE